jgi:hypothetical protein
VKHPERAGNRQALIFIGELPDVKGMRFYK